MSRGKKILLIALFILAILFFGYLIYFMISRPVGPSGQAPDVNGNVNEGLTGAGTNTNFQVLPPGSGTLPGGINTGINVNTSITPTQPPERPTAVARGGVTQTTPLTANVAFMPTISPSGSHIYYYDQQQEQFFQITPDGSRSSLSNQKFPQVENVVWSPQGDSAILEFPDGANIYYDFSAESQTTLPSHWEEFDFSPSGSEFVAKSIGTNKESRYLIISDPSGQKVRSLSALPTNEEKIVSDWSPNNLMVGMVVNDLDFDAQEILFIGLNDENFKSTVVEGWGFEPLWAPDGKRLMYSVHSNETDNKPELWAVDATPETIGTNRKNLDLQTWAHKCAFYSNSTVYCAVPGSLDSGAGFFPEEMDNSVDVLYKVDIQSGTKTLIAFPEGNPNMQNLSVSPDERYLYYTNKFNGQLYKIQLK